MTPRPSVRIPASFLWGCSALTLILSCAVLWPAQVELSNVRAETIDLARRTRDDERSLSELPSLAARVRTARQAFSGIIPSREPVVLTERILRDTQMLAERRSLTLFEIRPDTLQSMQEDGIRSMPVVAAFTIYAAGKYSNVLAFLSDVSRLGALIRIGRVRLSLPQDRAGESPPPDIQIELHIEILELSPFDSR